MNSFLDRLYASYVNLDHRQDRRTLMEERLKAIGIPAIRQRGMLPSEVKVEPSRIRAMWDRPQKGAIGCHFSQVEVMKKASATRRHALVMEDDLVFCSDFRQRLAIIEGFCATHEWDVIWLGGTFHVNPPYWHTKRNADRVKRNCQLLERDAELTDHPRLIRTYGCFCTYAYIVNEASIDRILQMFEEQLPKSIGIDHMFIMLQPFLHTYAFVPGCIKQYDHISDIGVKKDGSPARTEFSNFAKIGPYWWQDRMEQFDPTTFNWKEAKQ